jgi:hypothetical protein
MCCGTHDVARTTEIALMYPTVVIYTTAVLRHIRIGLYVRHCCSIAYTFMLYVLHFVYLLCCIRNETV